MVERISYSELLEKLSDPDIPEADLAKYFVDVVPNPDKPFKPHVVLNSDLVETPGMPGSRSDGPAEIAAESPADIELEAAAVQDGIIEAAVRRRQRLYRRKISAGWEGRRYVAEGDSWFQYPAIPILLDGSDVIDFMLDDNAIFCVSFAGDTLNNMVTSGELDKLERHIEAEGASALLFSGGGNDLAGRDEVDERGRKGLERFLVGFSPSEPDRPPAGYISHRYQGFLTGVINDYRNFTNRFLTRFDDLKIFFHGYDRSFPLEGGTWLFPALSGLEIPEEHWDEIIAIMINRFNQALESFANERPGRLFHVDCRGAIGAKNQWRDELHGKEAGCRQAAARFQTALDDAFAGGA